MAQSWFTIKNKVYVNWEEEDTLLLYDTENGKHLSSHLSKAIDLAKAVYSPENLGVVDWGAVELDDEIRGFIKNVCENKMGVLIDKEQYQQKPINFLPILNLQNDVERMSDIGDLVMTGENISTYLTHAVIHLSTECDKHCPHCGLFHKQTLCCSAMEQPSAMPFEQLRELIVQLAATSVQVIDLVGGDLRTYPHLSQLNTLIDQYQQFNWHLWQHIINEKGLSLDHVKTEVILTAPFEKTMLPEALQHDSDVRFHLLVENESQVEQAERMVAGIEAERCEWVPIFNGENLKFFEDNVLLSEEDILSAPISMREIFCRQKLNTNYFGKLHFFADGTVKADVNKEAIGRFPEKRVLGLVYDELTRNTAWRRIRGGERCSVCRYRFLCPSPGNYETVIGKENLCKVDLKSTNTEADDT